VSIGLVFDWAGKEDSEALRVLIAHLGIESILHAMNPWKQDAIAARFAHVSLKIRALMRPQLFGQAHVHSRAEGAMTGPGTKRTSRDVRSLIAIGGKADVLRTSHFGRD
jgi:hypothetical protein